MLNASIREWIGGLVDSWGVADMTGAAADWCVVRGAWGERVMFRPNRFMRGME
jgi:hypothetical protein